MKKRYFFTITGLGILLLCGVIIGNSIVRKVNSNKEIMRMMEEQKIVFICTEAQFSDNFQLVGYFIDYRGDKYLFDITDKFSHNGLPITYDNHMVYEYLRNHMNEYDKMPFLNEKQIYKCYTYLNLVDKDAEMVRECVMVDFGGYYLRGVRLSDSGEREFILLEQSGDWEGYNSDEYAQKIVEIIGKDTWMEGIPSHWGK